jgi:diguanylate cyclase (GGDEF)-like protein
MTDKILLATSSHKDEKVLKKALLGLDIEIFWALDPATRERLSQEHTFALLILNDTIPLTDQSFRQFPLPPATPILSIVSSAQNLAATGNDAQGRYCDFLPRPLRSSMLTDKIHSLLHIHHLQQELLACQFALQEQKDKNLQCQQQQNHYLEMLSIHDGLTGLFNRKYLGKALKQEMLKANTDKTDLALLLIDIDFFKETNKISGQVFGDSILNEFSTRLTLSAEKNALCFRFSGGDFIVLLPGKNLTEATEQAEKLRLECSDKPFTNSLHSRSVTVSIGVVALLANCPKNSDDFLNMADRALYQAKSKGRNRVVAYSQHSAAPDSKIDSTALLQETLCRILEKTKDSSIASIKILTQNVTGIHQDGHIQQATVYIQLLCERLGLPKSMLETFTNALTLCYCFRLLLHRELFSKKNSLSYNERKLLNDLPFKLADFTRHFDYFAQERNLLLSQGEKYNGTGYPEGLAGEEIPLASRIFSLADGLAAMNADRPHRKRLNPSKILEELLQGAGSQWDPALVLLLLDILHEKQLLPLDEKKLLETQALISKKKLAHANGHTP